MRLLSTILTVAFTSPLLLPAAARADLRLAPTFADHAVLQRGVEAPVWGQAAPGQEVTVRLGDRKVKTKADETGVWRVTFEPLEAGGPVKLTVAGAEDEVSVDDVMIGEVWVCAGQSNMQFGLKVATATTRDGWTVETAIPAAALGVQKINSGHTMGLQLIRNRVTRRDDVLAGAEGYARQLIRRVADERSYWQTTGRDYNTGAMMPTNKMLASPARFGELTLE